MRHGIPIGHSHSSENQLLSIPGQPDFIGVEVGINLYAHEFALHMMSRC